MLRRFASNLPSDWEHRGERDAVTSHGPGGTRKTGERYLWKQERPLRLIAAIQVHVATDAVRHTGVVRRLTTETKQAFKTTEFWAMVGVIVAILVSAAAIKGGDTSGTDEFIARQAWLYVAIVAGAYLISRGLAKSGSSDPYTDTDDDSTNGSRH